MQITLTPEQEKFILNRLQTGKYENIEKLLSIAFHLLEENERREQTLLELREKLAAGTEQIRQGKVVDGELGFQQLQAKLSQLDTNQ
jgi:antitoxin ParD1/3/4